MRRLFVWHGLSLPTDYYYYHLPSRFCPQGCYYYLPARFRPQGCFIYLRGFALKVVLFTFEALPSRLFYLPSRLRPQGCFIYLRGFALKVVLFTFEASPSRLCQFCLWGFALCFLLGLCRACWCVNFLSDMACPCPLIIIILFSYFVTIPTLILLFTVL